MCPGTQTIKPRNWYDTIVHRSQYLLLLGSFGHRDPHRAWVALRERYDTNATQSGCVTTLMWLRTAVMKPRTTVSELFRELHRNPQEYASGITNPRLHRRSPNRARTVSSATQCRSRFDDQYCRRPHHRKCVCRKHRLQPNDQNSKTSAEDLERHCCLKLRHRARGCSIKKRVPEKQMGRDERRGIQGNGIQGPIFIERPTSSHNAFLSTKSDDSNVWIVDSGASHHMTSNRSAFNRDLRPFPEPIPVVIADDSTFAMGNGSINFQLDCGVP